MCMPNHGRGRIKAAALHAWHIAKMHLKHALLERWSTDGRDVSGEEEEIVGGDRYHYCVGGTLWPWLILGLQIYEYDET